MSRPFRLGFLTHVHGDLPPRELYPRVIGLFEHAEELGFDSGWVAQHHLQTLQGRLPSPLVLLSAVAARTSRIHLGTAIAVLPLEEPLRLAEDAAVLDAISGGRVELGIGTGGPSADQFAAFGKDPAERRELYARGDAVLSAALAGEELADGLRLQPAAEGLERRVWDSHASPGRAREAGARGRGLLLGFGPADLQHDLAVAHAAGHAEAGRAGSPRIAAVRSAFPGTSRETRAEELWPVLERHLSYHVANGWLTPDATRDELYEAMCLGIGTPEDIVASFAADPAIPLASDLVVAVQAESTTMNEAHRTLEVLAGEIAPALGWTREGAAS